MKIVLRQEGTHYSKGEIKNVPKLGTINYYFLCGRRIGDKAERFNLKCLNFMSKWSLVTNLVLPWFQ